VFAVSDAGAYVAYCIASVEKKRGEVDSIYVKQGCRGRGIGSRLMAAAIEWLRLHGCTEIVVCVAEGNEDALGFYEKHGFSKRFTVMAKIDA
jgi:ribosomal protein S18 acetylase RimI-like enzyme